MPRRSVDQTIEHRISLGNYERALVENFRDLQKENQRLDALTATLQAGGTAVAGLGLGWAALALGAFLIPNIGQKAVDVAKDGLDAVADTVLPKNPVELRREAQRLAAKRGEINAAIDRYCTASSADYDAAQCSISHDEKDAYFEELELFRARVREANIEADSFYWRFIFSGLGDIEPDVGDRGTNMSWWEYFLNLSL
jgi:hypothetical protein